MVVEVEAGIGEAAKAVKVAQSQTEVPDIAPHPQRAVATGTTDTEPELGTASNPQPAPGRTK